MEFRILIKGGEVVDGAGASRRSRLACSPAAASSAPTFDNGAFTGRFPGEFVGPEDASAHAQAAE